MEDNTLEHYHHLEDMEFEINSCKKQIGQSIWKIGHYLTYVKEQNLCHGQFGPWLEKMKIDHRAANRMMTVARDLPYHEDLSDLGLTALYLIAKLPETARQGNLIMTQGQLKSAKDMTVKQLRQANQDSQEKEAKKEPPIINQVHEDYVQFRNQVDHLLLNLAPMRDHLILAKDQSSFVVDDYLAIIDLVQAWCNDLYQQITQVKNIYVKEII